MVRKGKELKIEEKEIILRLKNEGNTLSEIGKIVKRSKQTVFEIIKKFNLNKSVENKKRSGRPKILNERDCRVVLNKIRENAKKSAPEIALEIEKECGKSCSSETIRRVLRKNDYHGRVCRKKPFVSAINRKKRLQFAKKYLNHPITFWKSVIFSDEVKFNLSGSDGKENVWRKKNKELDPRNLQSTVKHGGGSVMMWGCMGYYGVENMEFIEGTMDHKKYISILARNLGPSSENLDIADNFVFQQDNDPKHTAYNTKMWLLFNIPQRLETPPQSPDLNPIEHLWAQLDKKVKKRAPRNLSSLKEILEQEWNNILPSVTQNLVESMPRRLKEVIKRKGYPTKY